MSKVSVIIPARFETAEATPGVSVLQRTVQDILEKATGDIEVIVGFDGGPFQELPNDSRVRTIEKAEPQGIKTMINDLANLARGKYLYKSDGHCMLGPGFDTILQNDMHWNWVVMPRFYVLDEKKWAWQDERFYDYFYLCCPFLDPRGFRFKAGGHWPERTQERLDVLIDETPQMHGSGWFVERDFFLNKLKGFQMWGDPMGHAQEPPYLGLKTWLGPWDGKLMVNKKTWYAHMHKGKQHDRGYRFSNSENEKSYLLAANFFMNNEWEERAHDIEWFIDKFMPMPGWPENWREVWNASKYKKQ